MRQMVLVFIFLGFVFRAPDVRAEGKEFFTSVVYGTIAGTLVGAATLAFSSSPGDNLMNIARGASLGLYAGILLGLYLTYGTDNDTPQSQQFPEGNPSGSNEKPDKTKNVSFFPVVDQTREEGSSLGLGAQFKF